MNDIFSRPISHVRSVANVVLGILLVIILVGLLVLVFTESAERGRYHGEAVLVHQQNIPFGGEK